jgi:LacI family transcriptional regulator
LIADLPSGDSVPDVLERKRIDGVILKGAMQGNLAEIVSKDLWERLRALPIVWVLGRPADMFGDVVQVNDMLVGKIAADHLLSHGHRRLAFVSPKPSQVVLLRRQASFTFYAEHGGATVKAYVGKETDWQFPSPAIEHVEMVQGLVDKLLAERQPPTAIFAPDDSIGAMIARALSVRGLQLGREISLISCNNDRSLLMGIYPSLTTLEVHAEQIGHRAVDQLAWRMIHRDEAFLDIGVEPTLIEGSSVARASD